MTFSNNLEPLLRERKAADVAEKEAKALKEKLDAQIRPLLVESGPVLVDGFLHSVSMVAGRKTFNKKAAIAAGLDLEPFMKVGAPSSRYTMVEPDDGPIDVE